MNLIGAAAKQINDEFGVEAILVDERVVSPKRSPFRTIATSIDFIATFLSGAGT